MGLDIYFSAGTVMTAGQHRALSATFMPNDTKNYTLGSTIAQINNIVDSYNYLSNPDGISYL